MTVAAHKRRIRFGVDEPCFQPVFSTGYPWHENSDRLRDRSGSNAGRSVGR